MSEEIVEERRGEIAMLTINRAERANALTPAMATDLAAAVRGCHEGVRVILLRGAGDRVFCGGYDLSEVRSGVQDTELGDLMEALRHVPVPTIAMVNGHAIGAGLELACACDLRVARTGVRIGLPAVDLGVAYRLDGLASVTRVVPDFRWLLLTGTTEIVDELGCHSTEIVEADELESRALAVAESMASKSPSAMAYMALALRALPASPSDALLFEELRPLVMSGPDVTEAVEAKRENRVPRFGPRHPDVSSRGRHGPT